MVSTPSSYAPWGSALVPSNTHGNAPSTPRVSQIRVPRSSPNVTSGAAALASVEAREGVAARVIAFLRKVYPTKTSECVGADCGVSARTIRTMIERESAPSAALLVLMARVYGAPFLAAVIPGLSWLDAAARDAQVAACEAEMAAMKKEIEKLKAR